MKLFNLLILTVFALVACTDKQIPLERTPMVELPIVITDKGSLRSGTKYYTYRYLDYPKQSINAYVADERCVDTDKIAVGKMLLIPVRLYRNSTYPSGYIDSPSDACVISATAKPYLGKPQ